MKVKSKTFEGFRPIQVTFTVETIEELISLKHLFMSNLSVPAFLTGSEPDLNNDSKLMSELMGKLHGALIETDLSD